MFNPSALTETSLPIHFVTHRETIRGVNVTLKKIAFVARGYFGKMPLPGENWLCTIVGDNAPATPTRGAIFLHPIRQITPQEVFSPTPLESTSQTTLPQAQMPSVNLPPRGLQGAVDIYVEEITEVIHEVTLRELHDYYDNMEVCVNGNRVGLFDDRALPESAFPLTVKELQIKLSNGTSICVFSENVTVISEWRKSGMFWTPIKKNICRNRAPMVNLDQRTEITWNDAMKLTVGQTISREFPFQWMGDSLTNGLVSFPVDRPHATEWNSYPIPAVPPKLWSNFLARLEGKLSGHVRRCYTQCINGK